MLQPDLPGPGQEVENSRPRFKFSAKSLAEAETGRTTDLIAQSPEKGIALIVDSHRSPTDPQIRSNLYNSLALIDSRAPTEGAKKALESTLRRNKIPYSVSVGCIKLIENNGTQFAIIGRVGTAEAYLSREGRFIPITKGVFFEGDLLTYEPLERRQRLEGIFESIQVVKDLDGLNQTKEGLFSDRELWFSDRELWDVVQSEAWYGPSTSNAEIKLVALKMGDKLVLGSDGLKNLTPAQIKEVLEGGGDAVKLTERALQASGDKNNVRARAGGISAIVIEVTPPEPEFAKQIEVLISRANATTEIAIRGILSEAAGNPNLSSEQARTLIQLFAKFYHEYHGVRNMLYNML